MALTLRFIGFTKSILDIDIEDLKAPVLGLKHNYITIKCIPLTINMGMHLYMLFQIYLSDYEEQRLESKRQT